MSASENIEKPGKEERRREEKLLPFITATLTIMAVFTVIFVTAFLFEKATRPELAVSIDTNDADKREATPTFQLQPPKIKILSVWSEAKIEGKYCIYKARNRYIEVDGKRAIESFTQGYSQSLAFIPE
ncbi:MAG: hypothetical protein AAB791_02075 [Patescibacteria group bacterium]